MRSVDERLRALVGRIDPSDLAVHNAAYDRGEDLFEQLVATERARYEKAARLIAGLTPGRAVDLGCFIPYMPMLLAGLGWEVVAVDRYSLYGEPVRQALFETARDEGFELLDLDMTTELDRAGEADLVLLMAVVEHLHGSPLELVLGIRRLLAARQGRLLFEVPNIATLWQRLQFARGVSPLPDYRMYLRSAYPFSGHNREMTVAEVRTLMDEAGFTVERLECFDYSPPRPGAKAALLRLAQRAVPSCRESIMALARPA